MNNPTHYSANHSSFNIKFSVFCLLRSKLNIRFHSPSSTNSQFVIFESSMNHEHFHTKTQSQRWSCKNSNALQPYFVVVFLNGPKRQNPVCGFKQIPAKSTLFAGEMAQYCSLYEKESHPVLEIVEQLSILRDFGSEHESAELWQIDYHVEKTQVLKSCGHSGSDVRGNLPRLSQTLNLQSWILKILGSRFC